MQRNPHNCLWKGYQKHRTWDAQHILRWIKELKPIPEVPHIMTFLADESPLVDDKLSTAEMTTVMWLSLANYLDSDYEAHHTIPVCLPSPVWCNKLARQCEYQAVFSNRGMLGHRVLSLGE